MLAKITWKGVNIKQKQNSRQLKPSFDKIFMKCNTILPKFINKYIVIYNGKIFNKILITEDMVGYKIGEFLRTRKEFTFKKKKSGSKN